MAGSTIPTQFEFKQLCTACILLLFPNCSAFTVQCIKILPCPALPPPAAKFFWFFLFLFLNNMVFTFFGIMGVNITPMVQLATVFCAFFFSCWNLFCGFLLSEPVSGHLRPAPPCCTLPRPALRCLALPHPVPPRPVRSRPALPCPALPCPARPCPPRPAPSRPAPPRPALPCPALPCWPTPTCPAELASKRPPHLPTLPFPALP